MNKKPLVRFHFLSVCILQRRRVLKTFILSVFKKQGVPLEELNVIFCDDEYLLDLNHRFLKHDFYTDILSFPLSRSNQPLVAEIYISVDRVRDNALSGETTFKEEIHRVIFHGVLHFCGYKDKTTRDIKPMRAMENQYLKQYQTK